MNNNHKNFKTKKRFGQHLLISEGVIQKIVDEIEITSEDIIVEIGVGTGQLTEEILKRKPKIVYGIELDKTAYPIIEERFHNFSNFHLIKDDYFNVNLYELSNKEKIKLVGNLPYNVSSLILVDIAFKTDIIKLMVFMIQKEVALKLIAKPKTKEYTFLSVFIQTFFEVKYIMSVPARFFNPPPKVVSAVIKLIPKKDIPIKDIKEYKNFVSKLFSQRRKMLRTKVDEKLLIEAGLKPTDRIEDLSVEDIIKLFQTFKQFSN